MNSLAFDTRLNRFGARLNVLFGSDISHWDVPDAREVVEEAYELVEEGFITDEDLKDFVFTNPATFYAQSKRDFFKGTVVEKDVEKLLG
jgi:predicted TIM-barrel fold metal-dependent hydrolase